MTVFADRVAVTSVTVGTGPMVLGPPVFSYQTWGNGYPDGFVYYGILDEITGEWEVGEGTLGFGGTQVARDKVLDSSSGGGLISWSVGVKIVYSTEPADSKNNDQGLF